MASATNILEVNAEFREDDEDTKELYKSIMDGRDKDVVKLCREDAQRLFKAITIRKDTVLHMATYFQRAGTMVQLLSMVPPGQNHKLTTSNEVSNTALHEAATSDTFIEAVKRMLEMEPRLLELYNEFQESPIYRAARFGQKKMFDFLETKIKERSESVQGPVREGELLLEKPLMDLYRRKNGNTVLHAAVNNENFELALAIAKRYPALVEEIDPHPQHRMTAFQLLACKPEAFRRHRACIRRGGRHWPCKRRGHRSLQERYDAAVKLAKLLVEYDTTWKGTKAMEESNQPKTDNCGDADGTTTAQKMYYAALRVVRLVEKDRTWKETKAAEESNQPKTLEAILALLSRDGDGTSNANIEPATSLFLATQNGCLEIVEAILERYPSAVEHIDAKKRTILHVAIKYRQMEILKYVERMEIPMSRLKRKLDSDGNSILHMVGIKPEAGMRRLDDDTQRPAFQLREEILFFERVQKICPHPLIHNKNKSNQTAKDLFAETNNQLQERSKEWIRRTAEQCSVVAVFIATVAFAAAYTIPGGPNQSTGFPILLDQPLFVIFTISDVLCLTSSLTSVIMFLTILTSPFQLWNFKRSLLLKLMLGIMFLMVSVSMMMLGFAATVILMVRKREQSTKIALYAASFLPVTIFAVSQLGLFWSLLQTFFGPRKRIAGSFFCIFASFFFPLIKPLEKIAGSFCGKLIKSKPQPTPPPPPPPPPPEV